jgi:hypothetical protein
LLALQTKLKAFSSASMRREGFFVAGWPDSGRYDAA